MNESLVGTTLGQYELQAHLGQGGMATVYRAVQPTLNRSVAVKVLPLSRMPDPTMPMRFRREAQLAASLLHPNIVPVYDFGEWEGYLFIVMALVAGGTLKDRAESQLPVEAVVRLVGQVADALAFAHAQGIYHRDIKPTNVLLERADWAMLGDFGIARAIGDMTRLTSPYGTIGTPAYMAPEQWLGGDIDGRADLYSLGIVLYQLLTGGVPFMAPTSEGLMRQHLDVPVPALASRRPGLPSGLEDVVQTALAKSPDVRYRHAGEFKAALEAVTRQAQVPGSASWTDLAPAGGAITTTPDLGHTYRVPSLRTTPEQHPRERRTGGTVTALVVLVGILAVLLVGAVGYIATGGRLDPATPTAMTAAAPVPPPIVMQPPAPTAPAPPKVVNAEPTPVPPAPTVPAQLIAIPPPPSAPTSGPVRARVIKRFGAAVREAPSSTAAILTTLPCNQTAMVVDARDGWHRVSALGVVGWVGDARIAVGSDPTTADCRGSITYPVGSSVAVTVASGCLSLRKSPSRGAAYDHCVPSGHRYQVVSGPREVDAEDWFEVQSPSTGRGWSLGDQLLPGR